MALQSINPATGEVIATYDELTDDELEAKIALAQKTYESWRLTSLEERAELMRNMAKALRDRGDDIGKVVTSEMGRLLRLAKSEEKSAKTCEYYAEKAAEFLAPEMVATDASESFVRFDPLGVILAVMPWNFPIWQVMRFAAPSIMAGNVGLLKHASNVQGSAALLEELFLEAGFPEGVFQNLAIGSKKVEGVLRDDRVKAATLTGSEYAGSQVAKTCGEEIKTTVLELGGSDPFIVLADADIPTTCDAAVEGRLQNAGQSCIAAKRFVVVESQAESFTKLLVEKFENEVVGDPHDDATTVGPLASESMLKEISGLVDDARTKGATILTGGERHGDVGFFYKPTIITDITKDMRVYYEETFGPVASLYVVKDEAEAIKIANDTPFGLGASIWTKDTERAKELAPHINAGSVFVNQIVLSDPQLPFGGIGKSGYGRELSHYGMREFVNVKTVKIK